MTSPPRLFSSRVTKRGTLRVTSSTSTAGCAWVSGGRIVALDEFTAEDYTMKRAMQVSALFGALFALMPWMASAKPAIKPAATSPAHHSARQSLIAFNQKEANSCRTMDRRAGEMLWADDGVDLIPGMQPMVGKAAISKWLDGIAAQTHGAKMDYCTIDWRKITI